MLTVTYGILEVPVPYQFEVLLYGFSGKGVLSKNKMLPVHESIHLTHCHVRQEVLKQSRTCSQTYSTTQIHCTSGAQEKVWKLNLQSKFIIVH